MMIVNCHKIMGKMGRMKLWSRVQIMPRLTLADVGGDSGVMTMLACFAVGNGAAAVVVVDVLGCTCWFWLK